MRVLLWTESFWPVIGGSEIAAATLLRGLARRGCEYTVVTARSRPDLPDIDTFDGVPVHRFPIDQAFIDGNDRLTLLGYRQKVAKLKQTFRPELIHISLPGPSLLLHLMTEASCWRAPTLATLHVAMSEHEFRPRAPAGEAVRRGDWVTACSHSLLEQTRRIMPEIGPRSSVVYNGLESPSIDPSQPPSSPVLLCVGRVTQQKGFDTAVAAMPAILRRFPDARLIIAGDGPLMERLRQLAVELGVAAAVEFRGWVDPADVPALINQATVVLMPSRWEPFGLVALQAGQMGRPIIASRVDGLPEVVADGQTGMLVNADNVGEWSEAVIQLLGDRALADRMAAAARQRVTRLFGVDQYLDAYDQLYRKFAASRKKQEPRT